MESQPQNPEFRIIPENFHNGLGCLCSVSSTWCHGLVRAFSGRIIHYMCWVKMISLFDKSFNSSLREEDLESLTFSLLENCSCCFCRLLIFFFKIIFF